MKHTKPLLYTLLGIAIAGSITVFAGNSLIIKTDMENAVQTIKKLNITTDGKSPKDNGENVIMQINNDDDGIISIGKTGDTKMKLKVYGNIEAGMGKNDAKGAYSSIVGGQNNKAEGENSTIAGGEKNISYGRSATIIGGHENTISTTSYNSTIGGGRENKINNAPYSIIPGGRGNQINAGYSFAGGYRAIVNHVGSFVRSAFGGGKFSTTRPGQFLIRSSGGVGINTNITTGAAGVEFGLRVLQPQINAD